MRITILVLVLFLWSCSTLMESATGSNDTSMGYAAKKNEKGETIYVRDRVVSDSYIKPIPPIYYPSLPLVPGPDLASAKPSLSQPSPAQAAALEPRDPDPHKNSSSGFLEFAKTSGNYHLGFHFAGKLNDYIVPRFGGSMFYSDELFLGLDFSGRFYIPANQLRPFAGVGYYVGDTKKCKLENVSGREIEHCEKKFLYAGYAELGLEYQNYSVFWRNYKIFLAGLEVPTDNFIGVGLRF